MSLHRTYGLVSTWCHASSEFQQPETFVWELPFPFSNPAKHVSSASGAFSWEWTVSFLPCEARSPPQPLAYLLLPKPSSRFLGLGEGPSLLRDGRCNHTNDLLRCPS